MATKTVEGGRDNFAVGGGRGPEFNEIAVGVGAQNHGFNTAEPLKLGTVKLGRATFQEFVGLELVIDVGGVSVGGNEILDDQLSHELLLHPVIARRSLRREDWPTTPPDLLRGAITATEGSYP